MKTATLTKSIVSSLSEWKEAIESRDVNKVIQLYHPDAVFWGEFSNTIRTTKNQIIDYYNYFLSLDNLKIGIQNIQVRVYKDVAIISGTYSFTYQLNNKIELTLSSFSFVYKIEGKDWLIVDHHSSIVPKEAY
ncbi:MAG: DUF4440 domain-containing protein [Flavobacteriales bacterium]|nr:DUF4440 domain-containing protein [Flavobacteriales bacterium]MCB9363540.1 DUF4440 domain-containing protein [Flavobacteriales bacterium]